MASSSGSDSFNEEEEEKRPRCLVHLMRDTTTTQDSFMIEDYVEAMVPLLQEKNVSVWMYTHECLLPIHGVFLREMTEIINGRRGFQLIGRQKQCTNGTVVHAYQLCRPISRNGRWFLCFSRCGSEEASNTEPFPFSVWEMLSFYPHTLSRICTTTLPPPNTAGTTPPLYLRVAPNRFVRERDLSHVAAQLGVRIIPTFMDHRLSNGDVCFVVIILRDTLYCVASRLHKREPRSSFCATCHEIHYDEAGFEYQLVEPRPTDSTLRPVDWVTEVLMRFVLQ